MKYLLLLSLLCLVSCSESDEHAKARQKEEEMLSHAEKKQEEQSQPAPEAEPVSTEPQCYEVNYNEIYQGNTLIATCQSDEVKVEACGIVANSCTDDMTYACLKEVRIKYIKKEVCDKKE